MRAKTIKAIITDDIYIPINRNVEITWPNDSVELAYVNDGEFEGYIKNVELYKHFREFILPSRAEIEETLVNVICPSVTGQIIAHNERDDHNAPSWSAVFGMKQSILSEFKFNPVEFL